MTLEQRSIAEPELRAVKSEDKQTIVGYAAVYNSLSEDLGGFREIIRPGAFADAMSGDVMARYNHERLIGRTVSGTLRLSEDSKGLRYEVDPPKTAADVVESIERGDVRGSSFAFHTIEDEWRKEPNGEIVRELIKLRLVDVGPVDNPAYSGTAQGGARVSLRALDKVKELTQPPAEPQEPEAPAEPPPAPNYDNHRRRLELAEK